MRLLAKSQISEQRLLFGNQRLDALARQRNHLCELSVIEDLVLGGGLQFDDFVAGGHDEIHVNVGPGIFFVVEVEKDLAVDDADADGGDEILDGGGGQSAGVDEALESQAERNECSGDGSSARAAIGLDDVAVDPDGALTEAFEIGYGAERAADEALNFLSAATLLSLGGFARGAGEGGTGKHSVLAGN